MRGRTGLGWAGLARRPGMSSLLDLSPRLVQHPGGPFLSPGRSPRPRVPERPQLPPVCRSGPSPCRTSTGETEAGGGSHGLRAGSPHAATLRGGLGDLEWDPDLQDVWKV